jgi:hypothetical protein
MDSGYHVELNHTQEAAENNAEKLENTDVLIMGPDDFEERFVDYLKYRERTPISSKSTRPTTFALDKEGPKIIAEQNASFCTLLLAFNEKGEGMMLHYPLAPLLGPDGDLPQNVSDEISTMKEFAKRTHGHILVTGTNTAQVAREAVIKALNLDDIDNSITIMTASSLSDRIGVASDTLANNIQGICFIPRQLSRDSRNKIILLAQRIDRHEFDDQVAPADLLDNSGGDDLDRFSLSL